MKALNGYTVFVRDVGVSWARLGNDLVSTDVFVFNLFRQLRQLPPDSLVIMESMTTIEDENVFFFFF